ncbi:MAG: potassium transporter TrkA [Bacteroidota bacterium]
MQKPTFGEKTRYYFENTMSAGPAGVIKWLAIFSLFMVLILGLIILVFGIKSSPEAEAENLGFIEGAWQSLMATLDSGTMGGDEGWSFRAVRFIATLGGIFLISILIGTISSGIDEKLDELKKGRSRVLETNHTLILGWSEKVFSIILEIIEANSNQKNPSIVILADRDKVEMEDEIRSKIENFGKTRIIIRSGSPLESSDIAVVSPNEARSIIVLANEEANADTYVIKSVLALTNGKNRKKEAYNIVAEIKDPKNMEAAELVGNDETVFVLSADLISRITAQTCRQSGLSVVYSELLQFDGDELYFQVEPKLAGKTYKDTLFAYEKSTVIGILTKDEKALINPPMDTVFNAGDSVIAISEDDDTIILSGKTKFDVQENLFNRIQDKPASIERTLILGWNDRGTRIIQELDNYVAAGSEVVIVADGVEMADEIAELKQNLSKIKIVYQKGDINDKSTLVSLKTEFYDHIILLSYTDMDIQESDAKTLICLLHLRNLSEKAGKDYSIVSEMLDIRNRELGVVAKADDFIVGDNLISLMLSQLSENKDLKKVYDVLFEAEGSEIYLKPVSRYVKTGQPVNFYTVLESAAQLNETAIGYRISSLSADSDKHFGVALNPHKTNTVKFSEDDFIIVVAED